jgi:fibronectin-binding autotransporter adhesin
MTHSAALNRPNLRNAFLGTTAICALWLVALPTQLGAQTFTETTPAITIPGTVASPTPGDVTIAARTDFTLNGTVTGNLTFAPGAAPFTPGFVYGLAGAVNGNLSADSIALRTTAPLTVGGTMTLANHTNLAVVDGNLSVTGASTINTGSTLTIGAGRTVTATGGLTNTAGNLVFAGAGATVAGNVTNSYRLNVTGTGGQITGDLVTAAGSRIDMRNATSADNLVVTGNMSGSTLLFMDVDLTTANAGTADRITVGGSLSGNVTMALTPRNGTLTLQSTPIVLIDAATLAAPTVTMGGLPAGGLIVYSVGPDAANNDIVLRSGINPELGAVAGAIGIVQGIIGSIVNRPSGAFVSGIAFDTPNNCSTGSWARFNAGETSVGATTTSTSNPLLTNTSTVNVRHSGLQGGVDFGCFESFDGGWDISGGLLFGFTRGTIAENKTSGDFSQGFVGLYANAATGDFSVEAQLRGERTKFNFSNNGLGLNSSMTSKTTTFSTSASYRFALDDGWAIIPTAGFSIAHTSGGTLNMAAGGVTGTLSPDSHTNKLGFIGVTLGRTLVLGETSALNMFTTLTSYRNFSNDRTSTFALGGGGGTDTLTTNTTKGYNEISLGLNYINVMNNAVGGIRQVNTNFRADYRFGSSLKSAGVTAQVRLQF